MGEHFVDYGGFCEHKKRINPSSAVAFSLPYLCFPSAKMGGMKSSTTAKCFGIC